MTNTGDRLDAVGAQAVAGIRGALREVLDIVRRIRRDRPPHPTQLLGSVAAPTVCTYRAGDANEAPREEPTKGNAT
jgi:hypothetical protein